MVKVTTLTSGDSDSVASSDSDAMASDDLDKAASSCPDASTGASDNADLVALRPGGLTTWWHGDVAAQ